MNNKIITSILLALTLIAMIYTSFNNNECKNNLTNASPNQAIEEVSDSIANKLDSTINVENNMPQPLQTANCSNVLITGSISNPVGDLVNFLHGDTVYETVIDEKGYFSISFNLDSSDYISFSHGVETTAMYINPGDEISLQINTNLFDETIRYKNSLSSSFLAKKYLLIEQQDLFGDFFYRSSIQEYNKRIERLKDKLVKRLGRVKNDKFLDKELLSIEDELNYFIEQKERFGEIPRDQANFYIKSRKISTSQKYPLNEAINTHDSIEYIVLLNRYEKEMLNMLEKIEDSIFISTQTNRLERTIKYYSDRKTAIDKLPKTGESAIDFTCLDIDGNEVSLSDYKGSYVYVDVWATWCGPCIYEIPYLKKLEEDYRQDNIIFMSVSIDIEDKKEKWKEMIKEENLKGVQLISTSAWSSSICKDYAINGIPRFMIFDDKGNVFNLDAPRPSSNEIRVVFDDLIK